MDGADGELARTYVARAMFALSAACEPPALRPDCPYSVELAGGVRTCRQQCHDLLAAQGIETPGPDLVPLPMPAARTAARAFDASEHYIRERGRHMSRWSVPALMWALRKHLTRTPVGVAAPGDPEREIAECLAELQLRGFDVDELVRLGMGEEISVAVVVSTLAVLPPELLAGGEAPVTPFRATDPSAAGQWAAWVALLDGVLAEEDPDAGLQGEVPPFPNEMPGGAARYGRRVEAALRGTFPKRVQRWLASAPLTDVGAWRAPQPSAFVLGPQTAPPVLDQRRDRARWLVERFTELSLADWSPRSRLLEFQWVRGLQPPPCGPVHMAPPQPDPVDLAETIAVDAVTKPAGPERHLALLKHKAIELLLAGQRTAASAVLDTSRRLEPDLPEPHNDYAFSVIPDDPAAALKALEHARGLGYDRTVGIANRTLCLAMLGRPQEALATARRVVDAYPSEDRDGSYLWDAVAALEEGAGVLRQGVSPRDYVLDLAVRVAARTGDPDLARSWRDHRDRLAGPRPAA